LRVLDFFINNKCNLNCSYCTVDNTINKNYDFQNMKLINFKDFDVINVLGGEPTLHPEFTDIIQYVYKFNKNIVIFSNGFNIKKLKNIDDLNLKFFITFHYDSRFSIKKYETIYNFDFKTKTEYHIILHPENKILLKYFNKNYKKEKPIYVLNNYFEKLDFKKILKLKRKYNNLNFKKIFKLFKNGEFISEVFVWKNRLYKDIVEKNICTLKDHFIKGDK